MAVHRKEKAEIHAELLEAKLAEKEAICMEQNSSSLRLAQEACVIDYRSQWADYRSQWADYRYTLFARSRVLFTSIGGLLRFVASDKLAATFATPLSAQLKRQSNCKAKPKLSRSSG
jgi:hypothetical protein